MCDTSITATILPWKNDRALHNGYNSAIGEPISISRDTLGIDLRRSNSNESRTLVTFNQTILESFHSGSYLIFVVYEIG